MTLDEIQVGFVTVERRGGQAEDKINESLFPRLYILLIIRFNPSKQDFANKMLHFHV